MPLSVAAAVLAGCGGSNPILRTTDLGLSQFVTTDAQQRVVISNEIGAASITGFVDPVRMTCTEPSPDVATATATSFGAALGRPGVGSGSFSAQHVAALAQLVERTATIQLLRDKMYQTCLAYANGAITGTTYTVVMSQLDKTLLSLLMGEVAGGAFGRELAAINTSGRAEGSASVFGVPAAVEDLQSLTDELREAQANVDTKNELLAAKVKAAEGKEEDSDEARAVEEAEQEVAVAVSARDEILDRLQSRTEALVESEADAEADAGGGLSDRTDPLIAETLRDMQEAFLAEGLGDSVIVACLSELGLPAFDITQLQSPSETRGALRTGVNAVATDTRSALGAFCSTNLKDIVTVALNHRQEIRRKRADQQASAASARLAIAETEAERAKAERATAVAEALKVCNEFETEAVKQSCIAGVASLGT